MSWKRVSSLILMILVCLLVLSMERQPATRGAVNIYASSVNAGCYLMRHDRCKIHVEPFTITVASGQKLVYFQLVTTQIGPGTQRIIYDFRPDVSNPVPYSGNTFTPSLVAKDFAATCGSVYTISLQGRDTGDPSAYNLGTTRQITCPTGTYYINLPLLNK